MPKVKKEYRDAQIPLVEKVLLIGALPIGVFLGFLTWYLIIN